MNDDTRAIDKIALLLGTAAEWDSAMLETIANVIGSVRPHPGDSEATYLDDFEAARGFDPVTVSALRNYIDDDAIEALRKIKEV